ncbi:MAG: glycosyltransferase [Deltaproteobacteria bacterium]|nr:glycosyltransferase [Deltaproteobacteria bacterium]
MGRAPERIRLCVITQDLASGGIETRMSRLLGQLPRSAFELSWVAFDRENPYLLETAGRDVAVRRIARREGVSGVDLSLIGRVAAHLRRIRPDIVHVHNWSTSIYGILGARIAGVRRVIFESGGRDTPQGPTPRQRAVRHALAPYVDQLTSVCVLLSREMDLSWGVPPGSTLTMPTGIELDRFGQSDPRAERARLGIPPEAIVIGTTAMFRPVKRIPDLVEAAIGVMRRDPRVHLLLIGGNDDGTPPDDLRAQVAEAGLAERVHLPGRLEDSALHLAAFDVFVNCSVFEGLSNAIIEAMAARLPVVATRVGGNPELISDGDNGLLVNPEEPAGLAQALERLIRDEGLRRQLGARGRVLAETHHGLARMVEAYVTLHRALKERRPEHPLEWGLRAMRSAVRGISALAARAG